MGWDSQNRKRRRRAEQAVRDAIGPTQERAGGWFSPAEVRCGYCTPTVRKYLKLMVERGEVESRALGNRGMILYRRKGNTDSE